MSARRCPVCAAAAPPLAEWCSLCYADLRLRAAEAIPPSLPAASGWPCSGCGVVVPLAAGHCAACGTTFLADLSGAGIAVPLPVVGDLLSLTQRQRAVLALGVAAVVLLLGAGAVTVGALLLA